MSELSKYCRISIPTWYYYKNVGNTNMMVFLNDLCPLTEGKEGMLVFWCISHGHMYDAFLCARYLVK